MKLRSHLCLTLVLAVTGCEWIAGIGDRSVGDAGRDAATRDAATSDVSKDVDGPVDAPRDDSASADATGAAGAVPGPDGGGGSGGLGGGGPGGLGGGGAGGLGGGAAGTQGMPDGGPKDAPVEAPIIIIVPATIGTTSFVHIAAASNHSCATKRDGTIQCWGASVGTPPGGSFEALTTGRDFTCGLTVNAGGEVRCAGVTNNVGQLNAPAGTFVQIAAGFAHACARQITGAVTCWGDDPRPAPADFYSDLSAGGNRRCLVDFAGHVGCVGEKIAGTYTRAAKYSQVAVGPTWSCGTLDPSHAIDCWDNLGNQFGPLGGGFTHLAVGGDQVCGVTMQNQLRCWNLDGSPRLDTPLDSFWEVALGASHACALRMDNFAVCWGNNDNLQSKPP